MADFVRVAGVGDIPTGEMLIVQVNGDEVVLANVDGKVYAFGNDCSHRGGPLGEGILEGDIVECPWHQARYNVRSGDVIGAPATEPVPSFDVRLDGDDIKVAKR
jgi:nitrite reductase/ring-hydroxylating ferredoxin subunit